MGVGDERPAFTLDTTDIFLPWNKALLWLRQLLKSGSLATIPSESYTKLFKTLCISRYSIVDVNQLEKEVTGVYW